MKTALLQLLIDVLEKIISTISPELRDLIRTSLRQLYTKAKQTPNPVDDIAIRLLAALVGFSEEEIK